MGGWERGAVEVLRSKGRSAGVERRPQAQSGGAPSVSPACPSGLPWGTSKNVPWPLLAPQLSMEWAKGCERGPRGREAKATVPQKWR